MQDISTFIFDLDGTISDPSLGICRCINHALSFYGFPEVHEKRVVEAIGPPLDETFQKFQPDASRAIIEGLIAKYRERYSDVGFSENHIYQGVPEALVELSSRGARLGVCTSKRADFAEKILELFEIRSLFSFVNGGDVGIKKSEQLAGLHRGSEIDHAAVMIGDRYVDISSAKDNSLRSVGVLWGFGDESELSGAGADIILVEPQELRELGGKFKDLDKTRSD